MTRLRVFEKSIELFRLKFTSSEIIGTEWQRCIGDVYISRRGRYAALRSEGGGAERDAAGARERDAATHYDATSQQYFFHGVLMGFYVETATV